MIDYRVIMIVLSCIVVVIASSYLVISIYDRSTYDINRQNEFLDKMDIMGCGYLDENRHDVRFYYMEQKDIIIKHSPMIYDGIDRLMKECEK